MKLQRFNCPVEATLDVLGGKWRALIVFQLGHGTLRFGELHRLIPAASSRMLTQQLRELEEHGVVNRKVYAQVPPKVEYSLTAYGRTLQPVLSAMCKWGNEHSVRLEREGKTLPARKTHK